MTKLEEKITALETQLKQVKALKQQIEARKKTLASKNTRAEETKKKILIGALIMEKMEEREVTKMRILADLDRFLTRNSDRALFDLPPRSDAPNN